MAVTYGFYNSSSGDRVYNATQISKIFDGIIIDGVFASVGSKLMTIQNTPAAMNVLVGTGRAWFDHTWTLNDSVLQLTIDAAHVTYDRIDIIVLEVDESTRINTIKVIKGTAAAAPVQPSLTNTSTLHQYLMAVIYVATGTTAITTSMITNKVGTTSCPFVTGPLSVITTDDLLVQWQSEFDIWFDHMKDQLTTDAAGNLQTQIDAINLNKTKRILIPPHYFEYAVQEADNFRGQWASTYGGIYLGRNTISAFNGSFAIPTDFVGDLVIKPVWGCHDITNQQIVTSTWITWSAENEVPLQSYASTNQTLVLPTGVEKILSPTFNLPDVGIGDIVHLKTTREGAHANDIGTGSFETFQGWIVEYTGEM